MPMKRTEFTCVACDHSTPIKVKHPTYFTPTIVRALCAQCKSRYLITFKRHKGLPNNQAAQYLKLVELTEQGMKAAALAEAAKEGVK